MKYQKQVAGIMSLLLIAVAFSLFYGFAIAEPEGATVSFLSNSTKGAATPNSRNDSKGTITTILLSTVQQNIRWKAYVGNISGTLVLRDGDDYSIYEWPSGTSPDGEVFITMNNTIDWSSIGCANDTTIHAEQNYLGHDANAGDNINNTFYQTIHESIEIGVLTVQNSTCYSIATWVNSSSQTLAEDSRFQEVLLQDDSARLVYTALIDQDGISYKDDAGTDTTYDFQAIVPDFRGASQAVYYFYLEIS